jgi:uncharacterized protein (TIGR00290 family)
MAHVLRASGDLELVGIVTTINEEFDRVAMHGVRHEILRAQADALDLPLWPVPLPWPCSNLEYESRMNQVISEAVQKGVEQIAYGDLFLEDIRRYRIEKLAGTGIEPIFPLWGLPTPKLARDMIAGGLEAVVTCIDPRQLDPRLVGRKFDERFLMDLPSSADPCGENGEFHTLCFGGPMFCKRINICAGEVCQRDGFWFADMLL